MTQNDFGDLCKILQDSEVMHAYEGSFINEKVQDWLDRQLNRYRNDGVGLYAVILKKSRRNDRPMRLNHTRHT